MSIKSHCIIAVWSVTVLFRLFALWHIKTRTQNRIVSEKCTRSSSKYRHTVTFVLTSYPKQVIGGNGGGGGGNNNSAIATCVEGEG